MLNVQLMLTFDAGIVKVHLFVPADVNVIPLAVGVFALYPVLGVQVTVMVSPTFAVVLLRLDDPPVPSVLLTV